MNVKTGRSFTPGDVAGWVAGAYYGNAKYLEGGNWLGNDGGDFESFFVIAEAMVVLVPLNRKEINIVLQTKGVPGVEFHNNFLSIDPSAEKLIIEGDWISEWGIIGSMDIQNEKLFIDVNPVNYLKTKSSSIRPAQLVSRYVMKEAGKDYQHRTVFNLEFEGTRL